MAEQFSIYKCELCGNVVELLNAVTDNLVCCGQPMKLMKPGTSDGATEKHVPVIEATEKGCKVKVGSVAHPMEEKHYIEWIEIVTACGKRMRKFLKPGEVAEVEFNVPMERVVELREYCNLHGLWKADNTATGSCCCGK